MEVMETEVARRLGSQLDDVEATLLSSVLDELAGEAQRLLGQSLVGVYLTGSFALGSGDLDADVDFLVATRDRLGAAQEAAVRTLHRTLPDREAHWAHVLEGSYAGLDDLRRRADPHTPWLYVDNGNREMEWSAHDNTEVFRWVLHHRAVAVQGPPAASLVEDVPAAVPRTRGIAADPDYLRNAWGQPHEVLTRCRLLFTATRAEVTGKADAATWCKGVVPAEWHDLIDRAVTDRPHPTVRVHQSADPALAQRTWEFIELLAPLIAGAAGDSAGEPALGDVGAPD
jgi:hypothetical protein